METTTIQITKVLKKKLEELKIYPQETMDQLIQRLAENKIDHEPLSEKEIKGIEEGLEDIKAGRIYSTKELKKELGI